MRAVCMLTGGPDRVITVGGTDYPFEDHSQFGPMPLTTRGKERSLGPRHPFWTAVSEWIAQGRRLGPDGLRADRSGR